MLYDPKWGKKAETKPSVHSLEGLIAWLEEHPAETTYDYCDIGNCLVARYLRARGVKKFELFPEELRRLGWYEIAHNSAGGCCDWTYGAALERARAVQAHS